MQIIHADFKIVTPMFISGADQGKYELDKNLIGAELRPPSIKGVIRFWWRAMAYARFNGDLTYIAQEESRIFGSTQQVSSIVIRVKCNQLESTRSDTVYADFKAKVGARYLGYGLVDAFNSDKIENGRKKSIAARLARPCFNKNQNFQVIFSSRSEIPPSFIEAIKVVGLLGGLGSRSRKGFGSLTMTELKNNDNVIWSRPTNENDYWIELTNILNTACEIKQLPCYSAFSAYSRLDMLYPLNRWNDPVDLLNQFGEQMLRYRSWGQGGQLSFEKKDKNDIKIIKEQLSPKFKEDHDWSKGNAKYRNIDFHPRRVVFGLPHSYGKEKKDIVTGVKHERRASPLFIHVHEYTPGYYGLVSVVLKSEFLVEISDSGERIKEKINAGNKVVTQKIDWKVLDDFLNSFTGKKTFGGTFND